MNRSTIIQLLQNPRWRSALFAAAGGLLAEVYSEIALFPSAYSGFGMFGVTSIMDTLWLDARWGAICGLAIGVGLSLAAAYPLVIEAARRTLRSIAIGAGVGLVGGAIGLVMAELLFQAVSNQRFIGRGIGYGVFGAFLGAAQGFARGSRRGALNGAIGGALGGFIGGVLFDLFGQVFGGDVFSRIVCIVITAFFIGLFVAVFQAVLAGGVLKVVSGRLEGREFYLDKPALTIGLDERSDIALVGDPAILAQHGSIQVGAKHPLLSVNPGAAARVNGQPVIGQAALNSNDELYLGNTRLIYRRALGRSGAAAAVPASAPAPASASASVAAAASSPAQQAVIPSPDKLKESLMASRQPSAQTPVQTPTVQALGPSPRFCSQCGAVMKETARFCGACGAQAQ